MKNSSPAHTQKKNQRKNGQKQNTLWHWLIHRSLSLHCAWRKASFHGGKILLQASDQPQQLVGVKQQVRGKRWREDRGRAMKQVKEGVAELTILKPDLAFLKAGILHQVPSSFLLQHKQSVLTD